MPKLSHIISEAFRYTKDHRKLLVFGIFLSWVTMLSLARFFGVNFGRLPIFGGGVHQAARLAVHSSYSWYVASVLVFGAVSILAITLCRICLINAAVLLHSGEKQLGHRNLLSKSARQFWPVFVAGVVLNVTLACLSALLFAPAFATIHFGYAYRGALLFIGASTLFLPAWIFLTILNIFASNFMVVFHLPLRRAVPAAVDVFFKNWDQAVALAAAIAAVYVLVFFMSAGALGFASALAYAIVFLLKSFAAAPVGIVSVVVAVVMLVLVTAVLVFVAAVLAVFTSIAWTIFFLESVGSVKHGEKVGHAAAVV